MVPCVVLGDSIAVGVGHNRPDCYTTARVGITSAAYLQDLLPLAEVNADTAIISLGVNDGPSSGTLENLRAVRASLRTKQVVWIVPYSREYAREAVRQVAEEYGDRTLDLRSYSGMIARDRVHPTPVGYHTIAARLGSEPDYQVATQYQLQPALMAVEPEGSWPETGAVQTAYARTRVTHEPMRYAWMHQPWARNAMARQALARTAWSRTATRHAGLPAVQRPTAPVHATLVNAALPTPPMPPVIGRIEFGRVTIFRTFHDWKTTHKG